MNLGIVDVPVWAILLVVLAILLYWYAYQPFGTWKKLGVKGPSPYPFVGNIPEMFDDRIGTCVSIAKWQKQYGRIFGAYFFRVPVLIVTDPDFLKHIFVKDFNNFTDRFFISNGKLQQRIIRKGLFFEVGADWKRIRRIMSPTFSSGKLRLLTHYMNLTAQRLGENLKNFAASGTHVEAKKVYGAFTLDVICGTAFGLDTNSQQNLEAPFIQHAKSMLTFEKSLQITLGLAGSFPVLASLFEFLGIGFFKKNDVKFFEKNLVALIQERKAHPERQKCTDFLQLLLEAESDDADEFVGEKKLTAEEIAAQGIIFIIAGYETTSTTLQYISYELAKNPDVQARIRNEISKVLGDSTEPDYDKCNSLKYTEAAISETLRMYPPVHLLSRLAERDISFKGVQIPAHTGITVPLFNIGRDPEFFEDPDSFKPERFLNENKANINSITYLPFGFGPRACIGMRLAIMELKIAPCTYWELWNLWASRPRCWT
ncbi:unnamed protein product [Candidula unifasciata]|uniref:Cytochrome P450 n=1 Tax=Candidula unifasciata TaxID=100452 RepID=A0A8S3YEL2_9EUPU|nr:unnamed protein product [Candidula unifasciata]